MDRTQAVSSGWCSYRAGLLAVGVALSVIVGVAPVASLAADAEPFPEIPSLQGNVDFWKKVFAEWGRDKAAIHDLRYPGVIYEVVALPGPVEDRYSQEQETFLEDRRGIWETRLQSLEDKVEAGHALTDGEKALALQLTEHAGTGAIVDAHRRVRSQRGIRDRFKRSLEISRRYDSVFRKIFEASGLPQDLAYLPHVESSFDASARSSAGAIGMWQFTKGTGRNYMRISSAIDERLDPVAAARGAARYMRDAFDKIGDWPTALTSYNHGVAGMARAKAKHGNFEAIYNEYQGRSFGFASRNFYAEFLAAREIAQDPTRYFPEELRFENPLILVEAELGQRTPPSMVALAYDMSIETLAQLNPSWSERAVKLDLALPTGTRVRLPTGTVAAVASAGPDSAAAKLVIAGMIEERSTHRVKRGDTLSAIAHRHGMSIDDICDINGIQPNRAIHVGQKLSVSTGRMSGGDLTESHTVRPGETLSGIADEFGMTVALLRDVNGLAPSESVIRVGQKLRVRSDHGTHVVSKGETLLRIAGRYGIDLSSLLRINSLDIRTVIFPGQSLRIPSRAR